MNRLFITGPGTLGMSHEIWYCDPCYQYLKQASEKNNCCRDRVEPTVIVGPTATPLYIPDVVTTPKFVGDRPLPDIRAILCDNSLKTPE